MLRWQREEHQDQLETTGGMPVNLPVIYHKLTRVGKFNTRRWHKCSVDREGNAIIIDTFDLLSALFDCSEASS